MLGHWLHTMVDTRGGRIQNRIWYIIAYLAVAGGIGAFLFFANESLQNILKRICYGYNSPVLILMSILFFLIFTTFKFKNKIVNWIGSSTLAVYCVHENNYFFRNEWYAYFEDLYLSGTNAFPFILLGACVCLFILCILLDKVRGIVTRPLMNPIESFIMKQYDKLTPKVWWYRIWSLKLRLKAKAFPWRKAGSSDRPCWRWHRSNFQKEVDSKVLLKRFSHSVLIV